MGGNYISFNVTFNNIYNMKIFKKIDNRLKESSDWMLHSAESLTILLLMGGGIGFLAFGTFALVFFLSKNWFFFVLFGFFSYFSLRKFLSIYKMVKISGLKGALGGMTSADFMWSRDKNLNKIGGIENGSNGSIKADEVCDEPNDEGNGKIGKEVRDIYRKSK